MKVTLSVRRMISNNIVIEVWTWSPSTRYLTDDHFQGPRVIEYFIEKNTIKKAKLLNIKSFIDKKIYEYEYNNHIESTTKKEDRFTFNYFPILGQKKCTKCYYRRLYNGNEICVIKSKQVNKNSFYKCLWWTESPWSIGGTQNLHNNERSRRDDALSRMRQVRES